MSVIKASFSGLFLLVITATQSHVQMTAEQKRQEWMSGSTYIGAEIRFRAVTGHFEGF
jgi:hypothetical protein